ncbi:MAG: MBL fold metallo-hydrolase [Desulfobacterales bacterium]|jgi:glyoxylase-like metal-dependent hydrolase (beta-lactamase superfamily II)
MCEEILPGLFRNKIPLPESPLKYLNSYIIKSSERSLIVDTGLNRKECLEAMLKGLKTLGIDLGQSDIFITHLHADHFGLVSKLATDTTNILFSRPEKELMESWEGFGAMVDHAARNGFPKNELEAALDKHPGAKYGADWIPELKVLDDGDRIDVADYHFKCVTTPGHTLGHTCLYDQDKKILLAGDHILIDITPNIQCWSDTANPLKEYLASLDKVRQLPIDLVLPGHRRLIDNPKARIEELKNHHAQRLDEVLTILKKGPLNAFQMASHMTWDIACESWDQFPVAQKWFALGEAIAHLRYLEQDGRIVRRTVNETVEFALAG